MKGDNSAMLSKISTISDDDKLLEIFKDSDDFEIKYAIVNLIVDDEILHQIFSIEENPFIKSIALNRISTDILDDDDFNGLDGCEKVNYIEIIKRLHEILMLKPERTYLIICKTIYKKCPGFAKQIVLWKEIQRRV